MYLQVYCQGMDVTLSLDIDQAKRVLDQMRTLVAEREELNK